MSTTGAGPGVPFLQRFPGIVSHDQDEGASPLLGLSPGDEEKAPAGLVRHRRHHLPRWGQGDARGTAVGGTHAGHLWLRGPAAAARGLSGRPAAVPRDSKASAQAWFQGLNPTLGDRSPARLLREGAVVEVGPQVLAAAASPVRFCATDRWSACNGPEYHPGGQAIGPLGVGLGPRAARTSLGPAGSGRPGEPGCQSSSNQTVFLPGTGSTPQAAARASTRASPRPPSVPMSKPRRAGMASPSSETSTRIRGP